MGGGYTVRFEGPLVDIAVTDNVFGPNGGFGQLDTRGSIGFSEWSGNTVGDSSGVSTGRVVKKP